MTDRDPAIRQRLGPGEWSAWPPALGVMALIPTAILVALLSLLLPLSLTTVIATTALASFQLCLVWTLTTRSWPLQPRLYGLRRPRTTWRRTLLLILLTLGASLGATQLYVMAATAAGLEFMIPSDLPPDLLLPGPWAVLSVIALAVVTPFAEEVFFRGFVLRGLVNRWGVAPGVFLSAVVFAGLHFQPSIVVPVFVTGLLLGSLYWQTGSIWPGIGVHAGQNLVATLGIVLGL